MADDADVELLLSLTKFLTADKCAAINSTACQTTGTLGFMQRIWIEFHLFVYLTKLKDYGSVKNRNT